MKRVQLGLKTLDHFDQDLGFPRYQTPQSAGADVAACLGKNNKLVLKPFEKVLVPTGLCLEIPPGYEIQVRPRSGLSFRTGLYLPNSPGTIDSDYRGELRILMGNSSPHEEFIHHGDRVAQIVLCPVNQAEFFLTGELSKTQRGEKGFGSTGVNHESTL
jgi:dUTP pyrophosphatase